MNYKALLFGIVTFAFVVLVSAVYRQGIADRAACLRAGYDRLDGGVFGTFCVGVRNGNTVTVPIESVR